MEQLLAPGETIAVGLADDGSSWPALEFAVQEAERAGARLQLVHAHDVPSVRRPTAVLDFLDSRERGLDLLRSIAAKVRPVSPVPIEPVLQRCPAGRRLLEDSASVQMIVVGRRSRPQAGRLARVSSWLVDRAECPIVVVPDTGGTQVSESGPIVALLHEGIDEVPVLRLAFVEAENRGADIAIVQCVSTQANRAAVDHLSDLYFLQSELLTAAHPGVGNVEHVRGLEFSEGVVDSSKGASMIVTTRDPDAGAPANWGKTAVHELLGTATCPMVIVPPSTSSRSRAGSGDPVMIAG